MKKFIFPFVLTFLLVSCSSEFTFKEINMSHLSKDIENFIEATENKNGVHLYHDHKGNMYIFLNGYNVVQGTKALHFTDFNLEDDGDTLNVLVHHDLTESYSDPNLHYQMLYKIKSDKEYDTLKLFENDEESSFHTIYN